MFQTSPLGTEVKSFVFSKKQQLTLMEDIGSKQDRAPRGIKSPQGAKRAVSQIMIERSFGGQKENVLRGSRFQMRISRKEKQEIFLDPGRQRLTKLDLDQTTVEQMFLHALSSS